MDKFNYQDYKNITRKVESGGKDSAKNPNSSASGRYQFTKGTWEKLGYNWKDRFNPELQEKAMETFTSQNVDYFKKNFKNEPSFSDVYGMHFLGAHGYKNVYKSNDSTPISQVVSSGAYNANKSIFSKYKTVGEFKGWLSKKTGQKVSKGTFTEETEQAPEVKLENYLPELMTMEGQQSSEFVDLSFANKAEEARQQIQQYQQEEDRIAQLPLIKEEQNNPQVNQPPTYDYLFNQDLFKI